jgi:hypothetical protein
MSEHISSSDWIKKPLSHLPTGLLRLRGPEGGFFDLEPIKSVRTDRPGKKFGHLKTSMLFDRLVAPA